MKYLRKTLLALLYILPAVLFFSYYPIIKLGSNSSMNFELSLPLIWLVLFDLFSLIFLISQRFTQSSKSSKASRLWQPNLPGLSDRRFFLFALFPLYLTISVFWSANPLRGLLTAGVMWLVFFAVFSIIYILPLASPPSTLRRNVLISIIISTTFVCLFCFVQSILDLTGLSREHTLLCAGCTYRSFGFPHPSGFAIEPQFMGNLLLAPTLLMLYLLIFKKPQQRSRFILISIIAGFFSATLFFTFSRGAIYAYIVALVVMFIICLKRHQFRWSLITIPAASFLISLGLQGAFSALSPTSETFVSGVTKSIHQLTLGIVDLRPQSDALSVENPPATVDNSSQNVENPPTPSGKPVENQTNTGGNPAQNSTNPVENSPETVQNSQPQTGNDEVYFEGYVPESTNIRLSLNHTAIRTWLDAPHHSSIAIGSDCGQPYEELCTRFTVSSIFFGVGLGGAGTAMYAAFPDVVTSAKEIVQNEFFSLLLETGLVGIALLIFSLLLAFAPDLFSAKFLDGRAASSESKISTFWVHPALPLLLPLIAAYLITLNFFSGLPNALQIYLMPPLLYLIFLSPAPIPPKSPQVRAKS